VLYLIAALLFLRIAGVHMHIHNHVTTPDQGVPLTAQFASGDDHDNTHAQDRDVNVLDASFFKKAGLDSDLQLLIAVLVLLLLPWNHLAFFCRFGSDPAPWLTISHLLPSSRAPPA